MKKIYFSPTGGTKKVTDFVAECFGCKGESIDVLSGETGDIKADEMCIIAVPSFGGRVPKLASENIAKIDGNGAKAVLVVTYGNRAYEDTLLELKDVCEAANFKPIAAMAVVCEHSILHIYGAGRPDDNDREEIKAFVEKVKANDGGDICVPGNRPYKVYNTIPINILTDENCVSCKLCAKKCPMGAIDINDCSSVDKAKCISCMRCVSVCPKKAKNADKAQTDMMIKMKGKAFEEKKTNDFFI